MEEWKECKLKDICFFAKDRINVSELNNETYISTENMIPNRGGITSAATLPTSEQTPSFVEGDILVSNIRPYFKKIWKARYTGGCSADVLNFKAKENISKEYLYYVLSDDEFFKYCMTTSKGTKMPRGDKVAIMEYPINLPPLPTQQKIAAILSSLDDKIELNNKINENLEQQAQALFKSWFIDFEPFGGKMPENWKEASLGNICECVLGGTPSREKKEYWNGDIPWINSGEVNLFRITEPSEYITQEGLEHSSTKKLPKKTTVIAITGATLGQVSLLEIDSCTNQSVVGIIPNENLPFEYIYPMVNERIHELLSHQTGGAQQHINKQNVQSLLINLPTQEILQKYSAIVNPIYESIANNCFENKNLSAIRDSLLPKLMNGEIVI